MTGRQCRPRPPVLTGGKNDGTFGFLGGADPFLERRLPKGNACRRLKPKAPSGHAIDPFTRRAWTSSRPKRRSRSSRIWLACQGQRRSELEQRVLTIRGRGEISLPGDLAPLYMEYQPGDYERAFTLWDAVDPAGIEARVRGGVLHLRLPKTGPAKRQRIEVRAD